MKLNKSEKIVLGIIIVALIIGIYITMSGFTFQIMESQSCSMQKIGITCSSNSDCINAAQSAGITQNQISSSELKCNEGYCEANSCIQSTQK